MKNQKRMFAFAEEIFSEKQALEFVTGGDKLVEIKVVKKVTVKDRENKDGMAEAYIPGGK